MKKTLLKIVTGGLVAFAFNAAHAELFVNPVTKNKTGAGEISAHFGTSSVDYEFSGGGTAEIDRTFIGATYAHGLNSSMDVYGTFSLTLTSEFEGAPSDGDGFILGAGVRAAIPNNMGVSLHGYGQLLMIDEDYGSGVDGEEMSIMLGVAAAKAIDTNIKLYGGLELNLFSDLDVEGFSADRDDLFGIRVGGNFNLGEYLMNVNLSLMHESGIFISGSKGF